ncbi:hypothetical protein [Granulosicoccus antarcticus]|uniref:hypothetical protein n=1 Tax=Granulosicoccus antarcticus TaxID=437505 RepID=UPI0012FD066A|nr:hypothetical protein [Granulosicoccus antarcticus]
MDDLIYSFLLQSDFPRAAIIFDLDLLGAAAKVGTDMRRPSFVIVDPDTAELLAIIDVVDAIDGDALREMSTETGAYASRLGGKAIQGFVIRVDVRGSTEDEQIQFYRVWPNSTLHQLSSKSFPDLGSLRVARKLVIDNMPKPVIRAEPIIMEEESDDDQSEPRPGWGMYLPAFVLLVLIIADGLSNAIRGISLLTLSQSVLAFGVAFLLTLPAAIRFLRR